MNNEETSTLPSDSCPTDTERIDWIQHMVAECEGRILTRLFLPDGKPFRDKVDDAMKLNPQ